MQNETPFGIAQIGKAFRNEIIARQFIFRMREFEQMEMQFFVKPGEETRWYEHWKLQRMRWHNALGIDPRKYRFHDHLNLAHYANAACDIEFEFPMGFKELEGIHSRTDFDLASHEKLSGKKLRYFDPQKNESYIPYVVETSLGLDRMFLAVLSAAYYEEVLEDNSKRIVLKLPAANGSLSKVAVLPLMNKDGLPQKHEKFSESLNTISQHNMMQKMPLDEDIEGKMLSALLIVSPLIINLLKMIPSPLENEIQ